VGGDNLVISRVTYSELMVLAIRRKAGKITRETVERLLDTVPFVEVGEVAWNLFPEIKAGLLQRGTPPGNSGNLDILQACIAVTFGLTMVTHNRKHFEAIAAVAPFGVEDWAGEEHGGTP
jgi:predicted nucleic acid-binding protein